MSAPNSSWKYNSGVIAVVNVALAIGTGIGVFANSDIIHLARILLAGALVAFVMGAIFCAALKAWVTKSEAKREMPAWICLEQVRGLASWECWPCCKCCLYPANWDAPRGSNDPVPGYLRCFYDLCCPDMKVVLLVYGGFCTLAGFILGVAALLVQVVDYDVHVNNLAFIIPVIVVPGAGFILLFVAALNMVCEPPKRSHQAASTCTCSETATSTGSAKVVSVTDVTVTVAAGPSDGADESKMDDAVRV